MSDLVGGELMADQLQTGPNEASRLMGDRSADDVDAGGITAMQGLASTAQGYARASKADNTRRAYRHDWRNFTTWCESQRLEALPTAPATLCLYLAALAESGRKASTIERRLVAISQAHQAAGHVPSPTLDWRVRTVMGGIRRSLGTAPDQKAALVLRIVGDPAGVIARGPAEVIVSPGRGRAVRAVFHGSPELGHTCPGAQSPPGVEADQRGKEDDHFCWISREP